MQAKILDDLFGDCSSSGLADLMHEDRCSGFAPGSDTKSTVDQQDTQHWAEGKQEEQPRDITVCCQLAVAYTPESRSG